MMIVMEDMKDDVHMNILSLLNIYLLMMMM